MVTETTKAKGTVEAFMEAQSRCDSFAQKANELLTRRSEVLAEIEAITAGIGAALAGVTGGDDSAKSRKRRDALHQEFEDLEAALCALGHPWGEAASEYYAARLAHLDADGKEADGEVQQAHKEVERLRDALAQAETAVTQAEQDRDVLLRERGECHESGVQVVRVTVGAPEDLQDVLDAMPGGNCDRGAVARLVEKWRKPVEVNAPYTAGKQEARVRQVALAWKSRTGEIVASAIVGATLSNGRECREACWGSIQQFRRHARSLARQITNDPRELVEGAMGDGMR